MKNCGYCGKRNPKEARHCSECGTVLIEQPEAPSLVDEEASDWILRGFRWALEQFGSEKFYKGTKLITPTPEHFPIQVKDPQEKARLVFERVQAYAGMRKWPCRLVAQEPRVNPVVDPVTVIQDAPKSPGGTFSVSGGERREVLITYDPAAVQRPQSLVAILAHELSHYLGHTAASPPPGGEKNWEYVTDLLAVFLGFGIFLSNSAVQFHQFTGYNNQGWSSGTLGYLSEFELVYCLAVFCTLKDIERQEVVPHLKHSLVPVYDDCLKDLRRKAQIMAELKSIGVGTTGQR